MVIREAVSKDLTSILTIYNQGIEDRIATLETEQKDQQYMMKWFSKHQNRYKVLVAEIEDIIVGWASLNPYNARDAYRGVADLSIYIARSHRGSGIGSVLLEQIEQLAIQNHFHKIVLFTFSFNGLGQGLYRKRGFREVGVFKNQGILDGNYVDVMAMEKLLKS
ncbi:N-acetyltransferase [Bacillus sp. RD4P76]|uniref:N-acetyltransferase n=2 Tax=Bacillus suaedaesalsae TaxID=2810349 RepID=A0ABS2DF33_9BACI|nr:arsinothricin resistance N-acetyltransferase ArsN1 family A [Bacillus suaedaesalsae]MBM6617067.1 N-acetyltransferase [Bacillus suaedaesalsae]